MSKDEKKKFLKNVTVLVDTREKENKHIITCLDKYDVKYQKEKLDFGDYSFIVDGKDFRLSCVCERKAKVDELYSNIMQSRERFEKEFTAASTLANNFTLVLENCGSEKELKATRLTDRDIYSQPRRQVMNIGEFCYTTLRSWKCRYDFNVIYVADKAKTAVEILEVFYWYYHNYKKLTAPLRKNRC